MKLKTLLGVLLGLIIVYALLDLTDNRAESSFDPIIIAVDSAQVDQIKIFPKGAGVPLLMTREDQGWMLSQGEKRAVADEGRIRGFLSALSKVEATRFAAKSREKWPEFEIGDEATHVTIGEKGKTMADFYVGRFAFNQQARSGTSYVRRAGEEPTYAVDGFFALGFNGDIDAFRTQEIWKIDPSQWTRMEWPPSGAVLRKEGDHWVAEGWQMDSTEITTYLDAVANVRAGSFVYGKEGSQGTVLWKAQTPTGQHVMSSLGAQENGLVLLFETPQGKTYVLDKDSTLFQKIIPQQINVQ